MNQANSVLKWEKKRWENFQSHLVQIYKTNSFQKNRYPDLQNCESWGGFDEFTEVCPLTCKQDLEKDRLTESPHGTNHTYPLDKYVRYSQTSGTTGEPSIWIDTEEDWQWMLDNWKEILRKAGVERGSACFFAFSFGPFLGFWTAYEAAVQMGCISIPGGGQSTQARLQAILDNKVEYLFCTPTYALRLIETAKDLKLSLQNHSLQKIIVAGECGGSSPEIRHSIDQAWGRESLVFDHYGMTEVGPVAYEIPGGRGGLRILLDSYHAEVIDPNSLSPLGDGELGELVLTPLGRSGSPVLRYRTGDLVRAQRSTDERGNPTFDLLGGIFGRTDQMVIVRGVNLYPSAVDAVVRKFADIAEYEVTISECRGMKEAVIRAECENSAGKALEAALEQTFSLRIAVECLPNQTLPRHEMKANRWKIKNDKSR